MFTSLANVSSQFGYFLAKIQTLSYTYRFLNVFMSLCYCYVLITTRLTVHTKLLRPWARGRLLPPPLPPLLSIWTFIFSFINI